MYQNDHFDFYIVDMVRIVDVCMKHVPLNIINTSNGGNRHSVFVF